jgi:endonuclease YncB( thermonuclease family)
MKKPYILFIILILVFFAAESAFAWEGKVVKIIDGDSLQVKRDEKIYEIRLYGIDTPEYKQPFSNKAKRFTKNMTFRQNVSVDQKDIDRYGRIVALVSVQDTLVNRELVRNGLAWFYGRYCLEQPLCDDLKSLESQARQQRRGLWRDSAPVSPWEWKRQQRMFKSGSGKR